MPAAAPRRRRLVRRWRRVQGSRSEAVAPEGPGPRGDGRSDGRRGVVAQAGLHPAHRRRRGAAARPRRVHHGRLRRPGGPLRPHDRHQRPEARRRQDQTERGLVERPPGRATPGRDRRGRARRGQGRAPGRLRPAGVRVRRRPPRLPGALHRRPACRLRRPHRAGRHGVPAAHVRRGQRRRLRAAGPPPGLRLHEAGAAGGRGGRPAALRRRPRRGHRLPRPRADRPGQGDHRRCGVSGERARAASRRPHPGRPAAAARRRRGLLRARGELPRGAGRLARRERDPPGRLPPGGRRRSHGRGVWTHHRPAGCLPGQPGAGSDQRVQWRAHGLPGLGPAAAGGRPAAAGGGRQAGVPGARGRAVLRPDGQVGGAGGRPGAPPRAGRPRLPARHLGPARSGGARRSRGRARRARRGRRRPPLPRRPAAPGRRRPGAARRAAGRRPAAASWRSQDVLDNRSASYAGHAGLGPDPRLAERVRGADLLVAVGSRLGEITTGGYRLLEVPRPRQTLVHVHPDMAELGRVYQADLPVNAGVERFAAALRALRPVADPPWSAWTAAAREDYLAWTRPPPGGGRLDLAKVVVALQARLPDAIVANGAGNFAIWVNRFWRYTVFPSQLGPRGGAMGYGLPAALAAKLACPERPVVAVSGDGDFLMTGQELATAMRHQLPVLVVVVNNGLYGTIRMHQERAHPGRPVGTDLVNPDFAALARAYGAHGEVVERTGDFTPAVERALAAGGPALLELRTDPELLRPPG